MNSPARNPSLMQRTAAVVAALFGLVTIVAGGRVLMGWSDPGFVVFRPLLIFNTAMGVAYLAAGVVIWRSLRWGKYAAATIFLLNLFVLSAIVVVYAAGGGVAINSLGAMTFRTAVWLGLFLGLARMARRHAHQKASV